MQYRLKFLQKLSLLQFLMVEYKTRVIDAHGPDAFTAKVKTRKPGRDGLPRAIHDVTNRSAPPQEQTVDMTVEDEEGAENSNNEGSESHLNRDGEGEQANTHVPSTPQQETQRFSAGAAMPLEDSEAAGFGSDTTPRTETGDNVELSRAERK